MLYASKVGTTPGTTTLELRGAPGYNDPNPHQDNHAACPTQAAVAFQVQSLGPPSDFDWMTPSPMWHRKWWGGGSAPMPSTVKLPPLPEPAPAPEPTQEYALSKRVMSPYADLVKLEGPLGFLAKFRARIRRVAAKTLAPKPPKPPRLGLVLAPYGDISPLPYSEIADVENNVHYQCAPYDPQYNQRGESGYYYDTPLGGGVHGVVGQGLAGAGMPGSAQLGATLPSDLQLSRIYGYTPVVNSWVPGKYINEPGRTWTLAPWQPPNGGEAYGTWGPPLRGAASLRSRFRGWFGLGADAEEPPADTATDAFVSSTPLTPAEEAVRVLKLQQDRVFMLSVASTGAIVGGFLLNVIKDRRERNRMRKTASYDNPPAAALTGARRAKRKRSQRK